MILGTWLLGCPRQAPPSTAPGGADPTAPALVVSTPVVGPAQVYQAAAPHLCVRVPDGWAGTTTGGALFLSVAHPDGFLFRIATASDAREFPSTLEGYDLLFEDAGTYRSPGLLPAASTRSWTSRDPGGNYIRAWYATVDGVAVEVRVDYPVGRFTEGDLVVAPLLEGGCN